MPDWAAFGVRQLAAALLFRKLASGRFVFDTGDLRCNFHREQARDETERRQAAAHQSASPPVIQGKSRVRKSELLQICGGAGQPASLPRPLPVLKCGPRSCRTKTSLPEGCHAR